MRHTIILGCSATKTQSPRSPARDLYDGPMWKVVRKNDIGKHDIFAISAKYGLIPQHEIIANYDARLNRDVSTDQLKNIVRVQKDILPKNQPILVACGKQYAEILRSEGFQFTFVEGGIGTKMSIIKQIIGE